MLDVDYFTKEVIYSSKIVIKTPETIINKVHGDKEVVFRIM
jgi:hypothetical protein